jgi:hypothetical protein
MRYWLIEYSQEFYFDALKYEWNRIIKIWLEVLNEEKDFISKISRDLDD